jgi:DNA-binding protein H-NS
MELSKLTAAELRSLQDQIKQELKKREHEEVAKAREQIMAIAQSVGVPLKELIGNGVRAKTGTVAVRYRHPNNSSQQWTGRGRQPKWVKEWVDGGKSIDALRV